MVIHYAILTLIILICSGCASTGAIVTPNYEYINIPPIDEVQRSELGDTIVKKAKVYSIPVIILEKEAIVNPFWTVPPQVLVLRTRSSSGDFYWGEVGVTNFGQLGPGGIFIQHGSQQLKAFYGDFFGTGKFLTPPELKYDSIPASGKPSFSQELIYNGCLGNAVKFLYREFIGDIIRAPFTQEIQYDLNESKIIGFKGARIEIVEATNMNLTYIVRKGFPDYE